VDSDGGGSLKVVPVRHVGRWIGVAVALVVVAMIIDTLFSRLPTGRYACTTTAGRRTCHPVSEWRFSWDIVGHYFTTSEILHGLVLTLELTVIAMTVGIVFGMVLAVMRMSPNRLLSGAAWTYTWFFRGTPVLVQLLVWYNIAILYPHISIGVPFTSISFVTIHMNTTFTAFEAACLALGLNEAAYMSEIARAGLLSVDEGQIEAATSIGMVRRQTLRYVVMPQAMRVIIPPTGNEVISMLKTSSLASVISVIELLGAATNIYSANYEIMPLLLTASLWYLLITTVLSIGQFYLERHFGRGALRTPPPTPLQRMGRDISSIIAKFPTRRGVASVVER
jgi:polar amino acid transport system permease protein